MTNGLKPWLTRIILPFYTFTSKCQVAEAAASDTPWCALQPTSRSTLQPASFSLSFWSASPLSPCTKHWDLKVDSEPCKVFCYLPVLYLTKVRGNTTFQSQRLNYTFSHLSSNNQDCKASRILSSLRFPNVRLCKGVWSEVDWEGMEWTHGVVSLPWFQSTC